ncbi:unnamed protein product [Rhizophagus irregularis]|nr:unnamed protein product [Rhizophagus irregularis]CAB5315057.1 unnamed protein product [Rhizophagus irregularis]
MVRSRLALVFPIRDQPTTARQGYRSTWRCNATEQSSRSPPMLITTSVAPDGTAISGFRWDVDKWEESEFLGFIKKDTRGGFAPKEYNRPFGFGMKQFINKFLYYDDETLYFVKDDPI